MRPTPSRGGEVSGKGKDACKSWANYLGCAVLSEACGQPFGTTQAPLCRSGSVPMAGWRTGERPQWHKGRTCAGLVKGAEYVTPLASLNPKGPHPSEVLMPRAKSLC